MLDPKPRELPWAGMCSPFRAEQLRRLGSQTGRIAHHRLVALSVRKNFIKGVEFEHFDLLSRLQLKQLEEIIEERYDELTSAWQKHFSG